MLTDLIAATTAPTPPVHHGAYDWWSDIWLPAIVGAGSIFIAVIAVVVAAQSKRVARDAVNVAQSSNELAERSISHEEQRSQQDAQRREEDDRDRFATRYLAMIDLMIDEVEADPSLWGTPVKDGKLASVKQLGPLTMETWARSYTNFPDNAAFQMVAKAAKAGGDPLRMVHTRTTTHAIVALWVSDPESVKWTIPYYNEKFDELMAHPNGKA